MTDEDYEKALNWLGLHIDFIEAIDPATLPAVTYFVDRIVVLAPDVDHACAVTVRRKAHAEARIIMFGVPPNSRFIWSAPTQLAYIVFMAGDGLVFEIQPPTPGLIHGYLIFSRETKRYYACVLDRVYAVAEGHAPRSMALFTA